MKKWLIQGEDSWGYVTDNPAKSFLQFLNLIIDCRNGLDGPVVRFYIV